MSELLSAPHVLEFPFTRSLGPVVGAFYRGLAEGKLLGIRTPGGRVLCPPTEYEPETGAANGELVEVGPGGVVTTWAWLARPRPNNPLDRPFAWALVRLDGADTAMLHAVDARTPDRMSTGMRVRARFRAERSGVMADLECFDVEE